MKRVFFLGSHPALSAAELASSAERLHIRIEWDLSRLPIALLGTGDFSASAEMQQALGGTVMIGTLRATIKEFPAPDDLLENIPELSAPREGKRIIALSALRVPTPDSPHPTPELSRDVRQLAMELKKSLGMKGTRVVFPPASRPDLSTAQLLHNGLPEKGVAVVALVRAEGVDLITLDAIQDIEAYAQRDRGRPHADPGSGMLPPKVAQMLLNLSLVPPEGSIYDPFCGVGTIPMEAVLQGLHAYASDRAESKVTQTKENLEWFMSHGNKQHGKVQSPIMFVHDIRRGVPREIPAGSLDAIVTEGWLGPARTSPPLPHEITALFHQVKELLAHVMDIAAGVVKSGGHLVVTVPAVRVRQRTYRFPVETLKHKQLTLHPLVADAWKDQPLFRSAAPGTLLYGRPDAIVLREIVRMQKKRPG